MENAKQEIAAIEQAVNEADESSIQRLEALKLTLVGGGIADPILF